MDILKIPHHGSDHLSEDFVNAVSAEHVLISAGSPNRSHQHPRERAINAYKTAGATNVYSTSEEDDNNLVITIGPNEGVFEINGTEEGFTLWRHPDDVTDEDECLETDGDGFCLMLSEGP